MSQWVPVLVRLEDYAEITALIADREARRPRGTSPNGATPALEASVDAALAKDPHDADLAAWTPWVVDDLRELSQGHSATAERWTRAMDACSEAVGSDHQWLSTSEVAERAGMSINEWRDATRKLTKHLRANYPNVPLDAGGNHIWPLLGKSKPGSPEVHWAMNAEQAQRWRQVRGTR